MRGGEEGVEEEVEEAGVESSDIAKATRRCQKFVGKL